jgi:hypothetical protein
VSIVDVTVGKGALMVSTIHQKLGTAGFVLSIVALVAALGGGAYAAGGGLSGRQKKEVEKIAKKYAGKPGATGATGATGPAGAAGTAGGVGPEGKAGPEGKQGLRGNPGETGFTAVLPEGETETGAWSVGYSQAFEAVQVSLSYNIPLSAPAAVHYVDTAGEEVIEGGVQPSTECLGTAAEPTAAPGSVCLYGEHETNAGFNAETFFIHPAATGATVSFVDQAGGSANGTWAVTAPEAP